MKCFIFLFLIIVTPVCALTEQEDDDLRETFEPELEEDQRYDPDDPGNQNEGPSTEKTVCLDYCYSNDKCCGYNGPRWGSICKSGKAQSPINLPYCYKKTNLPNKQLFLDGDQYKGKFSVKNDGHTVVVRFLDTKKVEMKNVGFYTLDRIEFRWSKTGRGAEHCVLTPGDQKRCDRHFMEVQFIHFKSIYANFTSAVDSNRKDAVLILSLFVEKVGNDTRENLSPVLDPIVRKLNEISTYRGSVNVNSILDFNPWVSTPNVASSYFGSLTAPRCRQVVNWIVLHNPMFVKAEDLIGFKGLTTSTGKMIDLNRRPVQKRNKREIGCYVFDVLNRGPGKLISGAPGNPAAGQTQQTIEIEEQIDADQEESYSTGEQINVNLAEDQNDGYVQQIDAAEEQSNGPEEEN